MKFFLGPIPRSMTFDAEAAGWTPLRSPPSERIAVLATVGMIPWFLLAGKAMGAAVDHLLTLPLLAFAASTLLLVPLHEAVHALAYRQPLGSPHLWTGIWLRRGIWYVLYDAPLPRDRVLFMLIAPAICLSLLPLLALPFLSPGLRYGGLYLICIQASLCMADLPSAVRVLRQIPKQAFVHNQGWNTYWSTQYEPQET
ncbi:MAG: DUF3267 domain-containing protein [Armatimonadota bacterium]